MKKKAEKRLTVKKKRKIKKYKFSPPECEFSESTFLTNDEISIYWRKCIPKKESKYIVIFNHGILEHVELYEHLYDRLTKEGVTIYAYDARGHGRTIGKRGYVKSFDDFVEDLRFFIVNIVQKESQGKPIFILSHSMGSLISMNYLIKYAGDTYLKGAVIGSIGSKFNLVTKILTVLARLSCKIFPNIWIPVPLIALLIKGDRDIARKTVKSPYTLRRVYARLGIELDKGLTNIVKNLDKIQNPVFLQYGSTDLLFRKQQLLYDRLAIEDKKIMRYKKCGHDIYKEKEELREVIFIHLLEWYKKYI